MDPEQDLQGFLEKVSKSLVDLTRTSGQLAGNDVGFLRSSKPKLGKQLDKSNVRLLHLTKKLLQNAVSGTTLPAPDLSSTEDVDDEWRGIVDVIDNLLERTDVALDERAGVIKRDVQEPETQPTTRAETRQSLWKASTIPKPQYQFRTPPTNASDAIFKPLLKKKPHSIVSFAESIEPVGDQEDSQRYGHPYQTELEGYNFPPFVYEKKEPVLFSPLDASEAIFVDTPEGVDAMLLELKQAREIAIDLEHHDKHSYIGLVSLMQISTRDRDWIVDTLQPWREDLQVLNEVFADPSILKILHGAFMDIIWLQRDLGLYIVGLFDTYHASYALNYQGHSLAFLLDKFADFKAQKKYQTADWRVRPLPRHLYDYARSDTHFLLNVYDHMRNELIDESARPTAGRNLIEAVMENSKKECLQRYEHVPYDADQGTGAGGWYSMLIHTPALFTKTQFSVFRAVHQWRDRVARADDESVNQVIPKQSLFTIARAMPEELPALHSCVQPMSEAVRERVEELLQVIIKAKTEGANGPEMNTVLAEHPLTLEYEQRKAERRKTYQDAQPRASSVGEVLRREQASKMQSAEMHVQDVATPSSQFWGEANRVSSDGAWPRSHSGGPTLALRLEVPLPPVRSTIEALEGELEAGEHESLPHPAPPPPAQPVEPERDATETIVLRERARGQKRKAEPPAGSNAASDKTGEELSQALKEVGAEEESEQEEEEEAASHEAKRMRKMAKKAAKDARREERVRARQELVDEAPFDYAAAPPVLHGASGARQGTQAKQGAKPYSKALDAPRGLPRVKRELQGKSMTFKN